MYKETYGNWVGNQSNKYDSTLTFKANIWKGEICQLHHSSTFVFRLPDMARRVLWIRVCLFFSSGSFLGIVIVSLVFSETQDGIRGLFGVVCDKQSQISFAPKMGKIDQKWARNRVCWIYWKSIINFVRIWSITKFYIICCIIAQIAYLGKVWFQQYGPKCSQPIRPQDF